MEISKNGINYYFEKESEEINDEIFYKINWEIVKNLELHFSKPKEKSSQQLKNNLEEATKLAKLKIYSEYYGCNYSK